MKSPVSQTTPERIEARARELCIISGSKPDDLIPCIIRKGDNGMPISGFMPTWHCYRHAAEKEYGLHD